MAEQLELKVQKRDVVGKATKRLRKAGIIPANIYGHKQESVALQVEAAAFDRLLRAHGTHGVLSLRLGDGKEDVLVHHVQHDAVTRKIMHIDFTRVSMSDRILVKVPLKFVGEAAGAKVMGGVFLHLVDVLEIECRASDMVETLDIDISLLADINTTLHAKDVKLPKDFVLITDPEELIAKIDPPRVQEGGTAAAATEAAASGTPAAENTAS
jgi:large subunit ribosomal protein L25